MDPSIIGLYFTLLIVVLMIAYAGVEGTLRVFVYLDLQLRYAWVRTRMWFMGRRLKKQLNLHLSNYKEQDK
tara:strand:- start:74 stop:286 length:213 start_codon:yes stop_codon:yes gene_type:complete